MTDVPEHLLERAKTSIRYSKAGRRPSVSGGEIPQHILDRAKKRLESKAQGTMGLTDHEKEILDNIEDKISGPALTSEDIGLLPRATKVESEIEAQVREMMGTMTAVISSEVFGEFIDASAKVAVRFFNSLIENGMPPEIAGSMAASYCGNLSQQGMGGN